MLFQSTRDSGLAVTSAQAIVKGLSAEGGLFVPEGFPAVTAEEIGSMAEQTYTQRAQTVLSRYLTDYTAQELHDCVEKAYAVERFGKDPAPLKTVGEDHVLELWHGPTHAFKDMALQILPHLMVNAIRKTGMDKKVFILVATSGDTGKAALEGFRDVEGTMVGVYFPRDGVSPAQKAQMLTQEGGNVHVCAVEGNFDDTQTGVKRLFADASLAAYMEEHGKSLSSANSINWGRLVPQIAYYFSAYADLIKQGYISLGEKVNFCVPTGNFGNILAGYYAMRMGLPVGRLICASNKNNILTDFITGGCYDTNRAFYKTASPSMDILISSNLERLLFELSGRDDKLLRSWMAALKTDGKYTVPQSTLALLQQNFSCGWASETQARDAIAACYRAYGYTLDPHTAVGYAVAQQYKQTTGDKTPMVVVSTASPYKFGREVLCALKGEDFAAPLDEFTCADALEQVCGLPMPKTLRELRLKPILHTDACDPQGMLGVARRWGE